MRACTFFGHRDCPDSIRPALAEAIIRMICMEDVNMFYVGHQGRFNQIVLGVLRELHSMIPDFDYAVVRAYHPGQSSCPDIPLEESIFPEEMEGVHPRFAISRRNEWMLDRSDCVIVFVEHTWGGAAKYLEKSRKRKKNIIRICR